MTLKIKESEYSLTAEDAIIAADAAIPGGVMDDDRIYQHRDGYWVVVSKNVQDELGDAWEPRRIVGFHVTPDIRRRLLAALVRRDLKARDLTLAWLARRMGITRQYLTRALNPPYSRMTDDLAHRCWDAYYPSPIVKDR